MTLQSQDKDLLYLIREEEKYAKRIRDALVFSEDELIRIDVLIVEDEVEEKIGEPQKIKTPHISPCQKKAVITSEESFFNPNIDTRRTVEDNDALYSSSSQVAQLEFSYADLVSLQRGTGRKRIDARTLRRLANLWGIDSKLRKSEMIARLLVEYARRYPQEVEMFNSI